MARRQLFIATSICSVCFMNLDSVWGIQVGAIPSGGFRIISCLGYPESCEATSSEHLPPGPDKLVTSIGGQSLDIEIKWLDFTSESRSRIVTRRTNGFVTSGFDINMMLLMKNFNEITVHNFSIDSVEADSEMKVLAHYLSPDLMIWNIYPRFPKPLKITQSVVGFGGFVNRLETVKLRLVISDSSGTKQEIDVTAAPLIEH